MEKRVEQALKKRVEELGGVCWKWTSPGRAGVPDRVCLSPDGRVVFVELKSETGHVSKIQQAVIQKMKGMCHDVRVINSVETARAFEF